MSKTKKDQCIMEGCRNHATVRGLCNACYAFDRYWTAKPARERMQRVQKLQLYETRMQAVTPGVTSIRARRRVA